MSFLRTLFGKDTTTDVLDLLTAQHTELDALFEQLENGAGDRRAMFTELANLLAAHLTVEEKVFFPAIMAKDTNDLLQEAVEEHLAIKRVLADLITLKLDDETFKAKLKVLGEQCSHHEHNEEEDELFPKVRGAFTSDERAAIGNEVLVMFQELMQSQPLRSVPDETAAAAPLPPVPRR